VLFCLRCDERVEKKRGRRARGCQRRYSMSSARLLAHVDAEKQEGRRGRSECRQGRKEGEVGDSGNDTSYDETTAIRRSTRVPHECVSKSARQCAAAAAVKRACVTGARAVPAAHAIISYA